MTPLPHLISASAYERVEDPPGERAPAPSGRAESAGAVFDDSTDGAAAARSPLATTGGSHVDIRWHREPANLKGRLGIAPMKVVWSKLLAANHRRTLDRYAQTSPT